MKKLLKLREWLTVEEAARHLTSMLEEEVGVADILRLGLDGHLTLSANFVNGTRARLGRVVPFREVPVTTMPRIRAGGLPSDETIDIPDGILLDEGIERLTEDTRFLRFDKEVHSIRGVWDLAMIGGERHDIEQEFQSLTDGPTVELVSLEGSFVNRPDGQWAQLQSSFPDKEVEGPNGRKREVHGGYFPAGGLPLDTPVVVRTSALAEFQSRLLNPPSTPSGGDSLGTRERETLLKIVIGMAIGGYGYDPTAARSTTPGEIVADLAKRGVSVSDDTVRKYLKEASATALPRVGKS